MALGCSSFSAFKGQQLVCGFVNKAMILRVKQKHTVIKPHSHNMFVCLHPALILRNMLWQSQWPSPNFVL